MPAPQRQLARRRVSDSIGLKCETAPAGHRDGFNSDIPDQESVMRTNKARRASAQVSSISIANRFANETPQQQALHREHKLSRERETRLGRGRPKPDAKVGRPKPGAALRMLRELQRFFSDRYNNIGPAMPQGCDGALDDFLVLLNYTAMVGDGWALRVAKARWAPWMPESQFDAMVAEVIDRPMYLTPAQLGARIGLYDAKRSELKIRSIRAVDLTEDQMIERRKTNKAVGRKSKRAAGACRPPPASEAKYWEAFGRSKSWWHAHGKPMPPEGWTKHVPSKLASLLLTGDRLCPTGAPAAPEGGSEGAYL
jgi:hypothetical protein